MWVTVSTRRMDATRTEAPGCARMDAARAEASGRARVRARAHLPEPSHTFRARARAHSARARRAYLSLAHFRTQQQLIHSSHSSPSSVTTLAI